MLVCFSFFLCFPAPAGDWASEFDHPIHKLEEAWQRSKGEVEQAQWSEEFAQQQEPPKALQWVDSEGNQTTWEKEYIIQDKGKELWAEEYERAEAGKFREGATLLFFSIFFYLQGLSLTFDTQRSCQNGTGNRRVCL